jgi:ABC-type multidrug transport system ATPase subunit
LKIITGYLKQDKGEIIIDGKNILENIYEARQAFSYVQQDDFLYNELTAGEHVHYWLKVRG